MKIRRLLAAVIAGSILAGCAGAPAAPVTPPSVPAEPSSEPAAEPEVEAPEPAAEPAAESDGAVHAVLAEYPAGVPDMSAEEYMESDAHWEWWSEYREKAEASAEKQDGMDAYYESILEKLLITDDEENKVCSPLNIYVALSMLAEVTDGESRRQVLEALHADSLEELRERVQALWEANYVDTPSLRSVLGDSLWIRDNIAYNEETLKTLAERYYASVFSGPMGSDAMNQELRDWTDKNTGGLLKDFTQDLRMDPETVMALVSTIYYKAGWYDEFYEEATGKETFHGASGDTEVDMMHARETMQVFSGKNFTAVAKGLQDSGSMYFFLPEEGVDVKDVLKNPQVLDLVRGNWNGKARDYLVNLSVPKFKVQAKTQLMDALNDLGIRDVCDAAKADFTPLTTDAESVYLSSAEHAALVEVDENGVTGAAYTILILAEGAAMVEPEIYDFVVDRPFAFMVTSRDGSILFGGVVQNIPES